MVTRTTGSVSYTHLLECETAGHSLYQDAGGKGSDLLDAMSNIENSVISNFGNPEFILEWKDQNDIFKNTIARVRPQDRNHYNSAFTGCLSPSMKMVEMYYTENGLPIDADNEWDYPSRYQLKKETSTLYDKVVQLNTDVLQLHLRREPRFYACIAADRTRWQRGPRASAGIDYNLYVNAYKGEMFGSQYSIITTTGWQNINGCLLYTSFLLHDSVPQRIFLFIDKCYLFITIFFPGEPPKVIQRFVTHHDKQVILDGFQLFVLFFVLDVYKRQRSSFI